jgi:outer membrane immunogenic protein
MRASTFKVIATAVFAVVTAIPTASAADLAARPYTKAPPVMVEVYNWTGFYIGGNAGYSWGRSRTDASFYNNTTNALLSSSSSSFDMDGWVAGGQLGYNWQNQRWVWGFEGDIQATGQRGSTLLVCPGTVCQLGSTPILAPALPGFPSNLTLNQKLEWFSTIRARAGYTLTPTVLGYVTGGLAIGEVKSDGVLTGFNSVAAPVSSTFSNRETRAGWTVGAGVEASLGGNWTGKIEYLYLDLGKYSNTAVLLTNFIPLRANMESRITDNILRAGINYRFGGPVVAKY